MSISLGIYDLFSYLIPGVLYLFVLNQFFRVIGWQSIDIASWLKPGQAPDFSLDDPVL